MLHESRYVLPIVTSISDKPEVLISHEPSGALFEGPKKKLCCEIDSNPNVIFMVWYKNSITQIKNNSSACLVLEKVTRQDSGNYTCFAGNEIGNGSSTASVVVFCKFFSVIYLFFSPSL